MGAFGQAQEALPWAGLRGSVRERRLWPAKATQVAQVGIQNNVLVPVLGGANAALEVPLPMRIVTRVPALQRLMARLLGMGVRPEHVHSPAL